MRSHSIDTILYRASLLELTWKKVINFRKIKARSRDAVKIEDLLPNCLFANSLASMFITLQNENKIYPIYFRSTLTVDLCHIHSTE